ncbi:MAG TPA: glycosyltransferase family 2 protein [Stellaceae bacterium]|nr:glycosyltransferase family 2 protein [Stellaceae bacterium]
MTGSEVASPKVYVCVLSWNKIDNTLACLDSVFAQDYPNLRVVVVDNGSTDGSIEALRALGDRIELVQHGENLGFTGGCNAGIRHALAHGADYVWLLNNDSYCKPETLSLLVDYAEARPAIGLVAPIIADRRTGIDGFAIRRIDLATGQIEATADPGEAEAMQERYPSQIMIKGTALLLKRGLIDRVGLLDDRFFAYCEDDDYCMRSAAAGFRAACVTAARVYHDETTPAPGQPWRQPYAFYYAVRNGLLFWRKHAHGLAGWRYGRWHACTMFRVLARGGYGPNETEAFADGLWSGLLGATGRWDPSRASHRMPRLLRRLFVAKPAVVLGLLEADPRAVMRGFKRPLG